MWTRQRTKRGDEIEYGLGFRVDRDARGLVVSHSGAQSRVSTMLVIVPERRVVVAVMCNLEHAGLQPLSRRLVDLVSPPPEK